MRTLKHALSCVAVLLGIVCAVIPARAQLSGNYSIGSGGDYSSFASALAALGSQGVSGPVHFDVLAGTYSEYVFVGEFSGVSATNTVTFDGGSGNAATRVLTYAITWNYGAVLTLDGADYVRFRNLTIASTGPSYGFAVKFANAADHNEISDCVITTPANTASTYHRGIVTASLTSSPSYGDHGSYNLIRDNVIESGYYGIQWYGASSSDYTVSRDNQFIGNTVKDFYYYGIYMGGGGAQVLRGNSVVQRSSGAYSTSGGYGIYMNYCNDGPEVSGNYCRTASNALRLYNHNRYASSPAVRACAYNNMLISDGTGTAYGMYVYYCQNTDVYFNSCRAASATGTVYGIYAGGSSSSDVRIVNNIVGCETSGTLRPVYVSSTSAFTAFDYNILYSGGTPSAESWLWESTTYASLAAMQAAVPGFHQHSQDAYPFWVAADNLHSTSPYAWRAGVPMPGITTDYDGESRDASAPCIGADEYSFSAMSYNWSTCAQPNTTPARAGEEKQDILRIAVDVDGLTSPLTATAFSFTTTGTTSTSDITNARLYYTGFDPVFSTDNLVGGVSAPGGTFTITGSQVLEGPGTTYFWLAYDVSATAAEGNLLDAGLTGITVEGNAYTPTLSEPPGSRSIVHPMHGLYTIDAAGSGNRNYTSFGLAINDLMVRSVDGPVTFAVAADTYDEQLVLPPIPGAGAVNTITFDGGAGNASTRIIRHSVTSSYGSVVKLDGADHVTFRDLTIQSTGSSFGYCMHFTNKADYNSVMDCVLDLPANTTRNQHIGICGSGESSYSENGDWGNHNLFQGNLIRNAYYGVYWRGGYSESRATNFDNRFVDNTIEDYYYAAIYEYYSSALVVTGNIIVQRNSGVFTASNGYGIYTAYANDGPLVEGNVVSSNYMPISVRYLNYAVSSTAARARICNNMFVGTGSGVLYGVYVFQASMLDIAFNSIHLNDSPHMAYGIYLYAAPALSSDVQVMNNTISRRGTSPCRAINVHETAAITAFDYNMYWHSGTGAMDWYWGGTLYSTISAMQTAVPGHHQHSFMGDPEFVSATDLHSLSAAGYRAGVSLAFVSDDIDGESRNTPPCIGADEYVLCDITCPDNIVTANDAGVCGALVSFAPTTTQGCGTVTSTPPSGSFFPVGTTTVTSVTDAGPECSFTVTVQDAEAPVITPALPISLWPVDHGYETITLSQMIAALTDNCDALLVTDVRIVAATSDEAETGGGSGNTLNDIVIANDCRSVDLRREREGTGDGRVYTIHLAVTDAANNAGSAVFKVHVPHNVSSAAVEGSVQYSVSGPCGAPKQRSGDLMPDGFALEQNYPNPFNPSTTIRFTIPRDADVTLRVYDAYGRCVSVLAEGWYAAGSYHMQFNGSGLPSGNYLCRLEAGGQLLHRSMLLAK